MQIINPAPDNTAIAAIKVSTDANLLENVHETKIFPASSGLTCTLTAGGTINTFGAWAAILDNDSPANDFSDLSASISTHISAVVVETNSVNSERYCLEVAYGEAKAVVGRFCIYGGSVPKQESRVRGLATPIGEAVYYRMMAETVSATLTVHIRYHEHT